MKTFTLFQVLVFSIAVASVTNVANAAPRRAKRAAVVAAEPEDWGGKAAAELQPAPQAAPGKTSKSVIETRSKTLTDGRASAVLPTAATIRAEVPEVDTIIERSALRFTFLFEPYQPHGNAHLASGDTVEYSNLPTAVLGQVDMRWLPFDVGLVSARPIAAGGFVAAGYSRQNLPLVAPSGFRYDDTALNTIRLEGGFAGGLTVSTKLNFEVRLGAGRIVEAQTSKYSDVVASYNRPFLVGALDLSYHLTQRFALVASLARRTPLADGSGSIAFDPLTVSGGFLVQVR